MDLYTFISNMVETQGMLACLLGYMIWAMRRDSAKLLHKNCELNQFIMKCLEKELDEDRVQSRSTQTSPRPYQTEDLVPKGTIYPSDIQSPSNNL